jgi:hypothetical protein
MHINQLPQAGRIDDAIWLPQQAEYAGQGFSTPSSLGNPAK